MVVYSYLANIIKPAWIQTQDGIGENKSPANSKTALIFKKAAEAEDALKKQIVYPSAAHRLACAGLKREAPGIFLHQSENEEPEAKKLKMRHGHMWSCTARTPQKEGGYVYEYTLNNDYYYLSESKSDVGFKNLLELREKIYPGLEPVWKATIQTIDKYPALKELGFSYKETGTVRCIYAPDAEALSLLWAKLREKEPQLPLLRYVVSKGRISVENFAFATIVFDTLLTVGKKAVHDDFFHAIPTITTIFSLESSEHGQARHYKTICIDNHAKLFDLYRRIELGKRILSDKQLSNVLKISEKKQGILRKHLDKFSLGFGYLADLLSNDPMYLSGKSIDAFEKTSDSIWEGDTLKTLISNLYKIEDAAELNSIKKIWKILEKIEFLFDSYKFLSTATIPLEPSKDYYSSFMGSRKRNVKVFVEACHLFPEENFTVVADALSNKRYRVGFLPFAQKSKEDEVGFSRTFANHMAREHGIESHFKEILSLFPDESLSAVIKILRKLHFAISSSSTCLDILKALHGHHFSLIQMKQFVSEFVILAKPRHLSIVEKLLVLLGRQDPWLVKDIFSQVEDFDSFFDLTTACPSTELNTLLDVYKTCGVSRIHFKTVYDLFPTTDLMEIAKTLAKLSNEREGYFLISVSKLFGDKGKSLDEIFDIYTTCGKGVTIFTANYNSFAHMDHMEYAQLAEQVSEDLSTLEVENGKRPRLNYINPILDFFQIAQALKDLRMTPKDIVEIQRACGNCARQFAVVYNGSPNGNPMEIAHSLGQIKDRDELDHFLEKFAYNQKSKDIAKSVGLMRQK